MDYRGSAAETETSSGKLTSNVCECDVEANCPVMEAGVVC